MNSFGGLRVFPTRDLMARLVAAEIADRLEDAVDQSGRAVFAAAGGLTPAATYQRLATAPITWRKVSVLLTDERVTPGCWPQSNAFLLRETLFQGPAASALVVPMATDDPTIQQSADRAERAVRGLGRGIDVMLLGMGEDGHVASLFPGEHGPTDGLDPRGQRRCIAVPARAPAPAQSRISLTLKAISEAGRVLLVINGIAKRRTLERALDGDAGADLPVRAVMRYAANLGIMWTP